MKTARRREWWTDWSMLFPVDSLDESEHRSVHPFFLPSSLGNGKWIMEEEIVSNRWKEWEMLWRTLPLSFASPSISFHSFHEAITVPRFLLPLSIILFLLSFPPRSGMVVDGDRLMGTSRWTLDSINLPSTAWPRKRYEERKRIDDEEERFVETDQGPRNKRSRWLGPRIWFPLFFPRRPAASSS